MTVPASHRNLAVVNPTEGYNKVAPFYDSWRWNRFWNANELPILASWLDKIASGAVLDAGCGTGRYLPEIQQRGHDYIGVDISDHMIEISSRKAHDNAIGTRNEFYTADIRQIPLLSNSLAAVLCTRTLSHIEEVADALKEFKRALSSGGLAIITDIHSSHPYEHTTIPTSDGVVKIETHKHSPESVIEAAKTLGGLQIVSFQEYTLNDLIWKPGSDYRKLYENPSKPIFYKLILGKSADTSGQERT